MVRSTEGEGDRVGTQHLRTTVQPKRPHPALCVGLSHFFGEGLTL
jgi:hypothetical protein